MSLEYVCHVAPLGPALVVAAGGYLPMVGHCDCTLEERERFIENSGKQVAIKSLCKNSLTHL